MYLMPNSKTVDDNLIMHHFCTDECELGYYEETDFVCYACSENCRSCETHFEYCTSC